MLNSVVCIKPGDGFLVVQHPLVFFSRNVRSFHQLHILHLSHEISHPDVRFDTCIHEKWILSTRFLEAFDFSSCFVSRSLPCSWYSLYGQMAPHPPEAFHHRQSMTCPSAPLATSLWTIKRMKPPWLEWSLRHPKEAPEKAIKVISSLTPKFLYSRPTSELALAYLTALFIDPRDFVVALDISPASKIVVACRCGAVWVAGQASAPRRPRSAVHLFSVTGCPCSGAPWVW